MRNFFYSLLSLFLVAPSFAHASDGVSLINPLATDDIRVIIGIVIKAALGLSGSIALLMFVWGGFMWLTSQGNAEKIEKGQKILTWAAIGLVVLFSAYTIVNAVIEYAIVDPAA